MRAPWPRNHAHNASPAKGYTKTRATVATIAIGPLYKGLALFRVALGLLHDASLERRRPARDILREAAHYRRCVRGARLYGATYFIKLNLGRGLIGRCELLQGTAGSRRAESGLKNFRF